MFQKMMKSFIIGLLMLALLPLNVNANTVYSPPQTKPVVIEDTICFPVETGKQMLLFIEKAKIDQEIYEFNMKKITELEKQISILQEQVKSKDIQIQVSKETLGNYQTILDNQKKECEIRVKAAKPTFMKILTYVAIGFAAGSILMIAK